MAKWATQAARLLAKLLLAALYLATLLSTAVRATSLLAAQQVLRIGQPSSAYGPVHDLPFAQSWGAYSPFIALAPYSMPEGCTVTMANILQRHGARFPTTNAGVRIRASIALMQAVPAWSDHRFDFVRSFKYGLGANDLTAFGAAQSFQAGVQAFARYSHLGAPFVRASGGERVVLSATKWTAGFELASGTVLPPPLIISEEAGSNTTLDDSMCPAATPPDAVLRLWEATFAPALIARLRAAASPPDSLRLTPADVPNLLQMCPFETLATGARSAWCGLWSAADAAQFEYWADLDKFYGHGYGNTLGPVQGVGYGAELIARLTGTPVRDATSTNRTLDADARTFPLDRALYADMSHDNQIVSILAALGLVEPPAPLPPAGPPPARRAWVASRLVPFAGRVVVEKLRCAGAEGEAVRVLINDAVTPICGGVRMCGLEEFVRSLVYVRMGGAGDWEKCFAI